jgi:hypothetical protein
MEHPLAGGAIPEESDRHIIRTLIFLGKGQPGPRTYLCTHDPVTAKEFDIDAKKVHAPSLAFGSTCRFSIQLGHTGIGTDTF